MAMADGSYCRADSDYNSGHGVSHLCGRLRPTPQRGGRICHGDGLGLGV